MMVAWRGLLCCCVWKEGGMDETVVSGPVEYDLLHVQTRISSAYGYARSDLLPLAKQKPGSGEVFFIRESLLAALPLCLPKSRSMHSHPRPYAPTGGLPQAQHPSQSVFPLPSHFLQTKQPRAPAPAPALPSKHQQPCRPSSIVSSHLM